MVIIKTSKGDIHLDLHADTAPKTVENFLNYVRKGFYKNTIFHRVIPGFMIQGGGVESNMHQKTTDSPVENEAKTAKLNKRGTLAMARTNDPHSARAQFFINLVDNSGLDFKSETEQDFGYCVFGEVAQGMDVVDAIAKVKTGNKMGQPNVPVEEVVIQDMLIEDDSE
jgi:peptidyl-prolyl cis-trans isomerase B (cyclophilin B)